MRAGIFSAVIGAMLCVSPAFADECSKANTAYEQLMKEEHAWYPKAAADALGKDAKQFSWDYFDQCDRMLLIAKKRLEYIEKLSAVGDTIIAQCTDEDAGGMLEDSNAFEGHSLDEMRSMVKEYIAICDGGGPDRRE